MNTLNGFVRLGCKAAILLTMSLTALASESDDLRFEQSDFMKATTYRRPEKLAAANLAPDGALSPVNISWDQTHTGKWFIEEQRYGSDAVAGGIAKKDVAAIRRGLTILRWGFEQQQPDGSFACPDAFHSTSFFVEAAAHACLLLNASSLGAQYSPDTGWMTPRLLKAALWMTGPKVEVQGRKGNAPYAHRRYLVAAALGETGVLTANQSLIDHSAQYITEGLNLQDPSGFNPEKGGYDSSYHAVGLVYAERYYDVVAGGELKARLYSMLKSGNAWLATRVLLMGQLTPPATLAPERTRKKAGTESLRP